MLFYNKLIPHPHIHSQQAPTPPELGHHLPLVSPVLYPVDAVPVTWIMEDVDRNRKQIGEPYGSIPKNSGMSQERDWAPYIPILRMGLEPENSYSREGSGFLGYG